MVLLYGCGGGPPPPSGAGRYLKMASESEKLAMDYEGQGKDAEALSMFRDALEKIEAGLKCARDSERPPFRTIKERVDPKIAELEMREKLKQERAEAAAKKEEEEKKAQALGKASANKEEDAKRKAEQVAKQADKEAAARKKLAEDADAAKAAKKNVAGADEEPAANAATGDAAKKEEAPKPPEGPFKVYSGKDEPPRLAVDKLEVRGEFIYAYIHVYNAGATNKRVARPEVIFTTFNDVDLCPADIYVDYTKFNKAMPNPLDHTEGLILGGNTEVLATSPLQFVAIAQNKEKASRAKKVRVQMFFEDNTNWTAKGPLDAKPSAAEGLPGL